MGHLLLVLAHGDTAVKATLCAAPTLRSLFAAVEFAGEPLQLTALKAVKHLTSDPTMLDALQARITFHWFPRPPWFPSRRIGTGELQGIIQA